VVVDVVALDGKQLGHVVGGHPRRHRLPAPKQLYDSLGDGVG
jgi:hypothetical protein